MDGRRLNTLAQKLLEGVAAKSPLTGGDGVPECRIAISRGDAVLKRVSTDLASLSTERRRADYDATDAVDRAANTIAKLDDVRDNATPDRMGAIAVAILNWLKSAQSAGIRQKSGTG